jgi:hypothetical protein
MVDNDDKKFIKDRSVFKNWKEDTDDLLRKMFENDMSYSKIHRVLRGNEDELSEV